MQEYQDDQKFLRIVIGALTDKVFLSSNSNVMGMSFHAAMFGDLARFFKQKMKDPLDKPSSRISTWYRIRDFLTSEMFKKDIEMVRKACSLSMTEYLENVFPEYLDP